PAYLVEMPNSPTYVIDWEGGWYGFVPAGAKYLKGGVWAGGTGSKETQLGPLAMVMGRYGRLNKSFRAGFGLSGEQQQGGNNQQNPQPQNSCQRMADMVAQIANEASGSEDFYDRIARAFTAASHSGIFEMLRTADNPLPAGRIDFDVSGFKPEFRDDSNQVRHFAGGLIAGFRLGYPYGRYVMNERETEGIGDADIALNNQSTWLGAVYRNAPGSLDHYIDFVGNAIGISGHYGQLADQIRRRICE
ncbi:MAG: hypothetical protein SF097_26050, partial [Acidobacteriota bacterium]|nr:hypothetical protein [Acidobacteriota bacterium]